MPAKLFSGSAAIAPEPGGPEAGKPSTVLIVEDDDVDFALLRDLLRPTGCSLERAANLRAAQHRAGEGSPQVDLVIADLHLGGGWPATTFDALALAWDHKPIIVVSGCSSQLNTVTRRPYPIVEVFDKNAFDASAFLTAIDTVLHAGHAVPRVGPRG